VTYTREGLVWQGKESLYHNLITLLSEINFQGFDVKVEFEYKCNKGVPPGCVIGSARFDRNGLFPDFRGYHFGFQENGKEVFIKKYGEPVGKEKNPVKAGKWTINQVVKHGKGMFFNIDGKTVLSYYDDSPPGSSGPFVSLFLRKGSDAIIKNIRIFLKEKAAISERVEAEVSLLNKTENTYLIHQIVAEITTRNRKIVRAFQLEDVSSFKQNIKRLEREKTLEREEKEKLKVLLDQKTQGDESFIGKSKPIFEIKDKARLIAETRTTVLITGETGTGKEVLARYIHENSAFKNGPFIRVDCAALPPTLIESELFGHEKGAFSGAVAKKKGKFELARKGTLFLDEIGNISTEVQTKLLGFLNDFVIQPIGSERSVKLDLRVICATNVDLNGLVKEGRFREDLYFRLNVVKFTLPPLRDRPDDIPDLSIHYLKKYNSEFSKTVKSISSNAFQTLYSHAWPGNVRELESVIQKAVLFTNKDIIEEDTIELEAGARKAAGTGSAAKPKVNTRKLTKEDIEGLIKDYNGNLNQVAKVTGIARKTLYNKVEKFGIDVGQLRG
jgi:transcriptional regulator with PAS, ATPase and Fis domain